MASSSAPAAAPGPVPSGRQRIASAAGDRSLSEIEVAWADHLGHTLGKRLPAAGFLEQPTGERVGAAAVPIKVLCRLLGVPEHDEGLLIDLGDQMIANTDPDLASVLLDGGESEQYRLLPFRSPAALQMFDYSRRLSQARQRQPRPDLVTALVQGTIGGRPLPDREIDAMFLLLVVAGNETTRQAIALGVQALLDHPGQIAVLHSADDRGWRTAVEELLRWTTPLHHFRRTATRDVELGRSKIAAGDKVVVWYTSANRDENVFRDPYRLDLRRSPNPHTTFGRGGPHRCLGEHLARLELRVLLQELLPVLPRLEPDGEPARIRSNFTNGLKHLPVRISCGEKTADARLLHLPGVPGPGLGRVSPAGLPRSGRCPRCRGSRRSCRHGT